MYCTKSVIMICRKIAQFTELWILYWQVFDLTPLKIVEKVILVEVSKWIPCEKGLIKKYTKTYMNVKISCVYSVYVPDSSRSCILRGTERFKISKMCLTKWIKSLKIIKTKKFFWVQWKLLFLLAVINSQRLHIK